MSRSRNWIYTSYETDRPQPPDTTQHVVQQELCPTTNRKHWQGVVTFRHAKTAKAAQKAIGAGIHIERCVNLQKAIKYCQKKETSIPGTQYKQTNEPEEENWWQGLTTQELWQNHSKWMLRHHNGVAAFQRAVQPQQHPRPTPKVIFLYGEPGTGKSWSARNTTETYFAKANGQWWDGYTNQETVIFDDFYGDEKLSDMLRWLSELPIRVPVKGSTVQLKATQFIITSNKHIQDMYKHTEALMRRITHIIFCTNDIFYIQKRPH